METKITKANSTNYFEIKDLFSNLGEYFHFDYKHIESEEEFTKYLEDNEVYILKESVSNKVLGVYLCVISPNKVSGRGIIINNYYRGQGLGKKLLVGIKDIFPNSIIIEVIHPQNIPSIKLYLNQGFIITGYIKDFLDHGEPRLLLQFTPEP